MCHEICHFSYNDYTLYDNIKSIPNYHNKMMSAFDTQQLLHQLRSLDPFSSGPKNADGLVVLPYEDRTLLFQYLEHEQWNDAITRAKSNPEEAQAWQEKVIDKQKAIKRCLLPLHAALNLDAPRPVLLAVLEAYPGALQCQNDFGQLPLHLAMKKEVFDLELVDAFLLVYPNGCQVPDQNGHLAVSLHDKNPTKLFRSIEQRQWDNAVRQVGSYPQEAKVWTFRREDQSPKLRWTLSPLHAAIIYAAPDKVVKAILEAFPEAASKKDDEGTFILFYILFVVPTLTIYDCKSLYL